MKKINLIGSLVLNSSFIASTLYFASFVGNKEATVFQAFFVIFWALLALFFITATTIGYCVLGDVSSKSEVKWFLIPSYGFFNSLQEWYDNLND